MSTASRLTAAVTHVSTQPLLPQHLPPHPLFVTASLRTDICPSRREEVVIVDRMTDPRIATADLDSFINVIGLSPKDPLDTFVEIWFYVFAWSFFSSIIVHIGAAGAAFASLRRHKVARFWPLLILISGIVTPLCVSLITSALIAGVYRAAFFVMAPFYGLLFGVGQTLLTLVFAYTRILATL